MDRIDAMRAFVTVVNEGSFTRAAEHLELSPQLVSKYVSRLEQHLGVRLLNRTTRKIHLTEAGSEYHQRAQLVLSEIEDMESQLGDLDSQARGRLRISAPVSFAGLPRYGWPCVRPRTICSVLVLPARPRSCRTTVICITAISGWTAGSPCTNGCSSELRVPVAPWSVITVMFWWRRPSPERALSCSPRLSVAMRSGKGSCRSYCRTMHLSPWRSMPCMPTASYWPARSGASWTFWPAILATRHTGTGQARIRAQIKAVVRGAAGRQLCHHVLRP